MWLEKYKTIIGVAALLLSFIGGFFAGRSKKDVITKTEYVRGKTIHDTVPAFDLNPYHSEIPDNPVLPKKQVRIPVLAQSGGTAIIHDSIPYEVVQVVDTTKIIQEYITENSYRNTLFDNKEHGKLTINQKIQFNRIKEMNYDFEPVEKIITKERKRTFVPYIGLGYNNFNQANVNGGFFIKNTGVQASYIYDVDAKKKGVGLGVVFKF